MATGLLSLADLAKISEDKLICRLAHGLIEKGWRWERGRKCYIKGYVEDSLPARGQKRKRLDAVLKEMDRQLTVRDARESNPPHFHSTTSFQERIKRIYIKVLPDAYRQPISHVVPAQYKSYSKVDGHHIFVVGDYWRTDLIIVHPHGQADHYKTRRAGRGSDVGHLAMSETLNALCPEALSRAFTKGSRIETDFCLGAIKLISKSGVVSHKNLETHADEYSTAARHSCPLYLKDN